VLVKPRPLTQPTSRKRIDHPMSSTDTITITLLGEFGVSVNGSPVDAAYWRFKHPRLLWQMLCLAPQHRVSRDEAVEALWPQAGVQASSNRLYHTLHTLRGALGSLGWADARRVIVLQGGTISLGPALELDIDAQRFAQAVSAARACKDGVAVTRALEQARAIHGGVLALPAGAGPWFAPYAEALQRDLVWVLEQIAERHQAAGRLDDAIEAAQALVQAEPSHEAAHRRLIELYDRQGRQDLMAQQYAACSRYLRRDLGLEPSAATRQLAERIHQRAPSDAATSEANCTSTAPRFAAPPRTTPLLGRDAELDELQRWLLQEDDSARLITIAAAGGIGKTRLAAALAEQVQDHFADGVRFVALGSVQRPSRLAEHVCQQLGLPPTEQPAEHVLVQALASRHMLLVLDRFEHLQDAAGPLAQWLQAAPKLHIVVTSQCALKSRAERVFELLPLGLRAPNAAIELFVRTARHAGAALDAEREAASIRQVCERLGGNPLAIELAAAQLARAPLSGLPAALHRPLQLLVRAGPDPEPQHMSLRATIEWSVSLLAADEARLLAMVSVFVADFSAEEAQSVLGPLFDVGVLPSMLRMLLERHLLSRRAAAAAEEAPSRFVLADTVREYAQHAVAALPQWPQVAAAHAMHFAQVAFAAVDLVEAGQGGRAQDIYRLAAADLEQSLQWHRAHADRRQHLRLCLMLGHLHGSLGALRDSVECLHKGTALVAEGREEQDLSAWCHYRLSRIQSAFGPTPAAVRTAAAARRLARGSQDQRLLDDIDTYLSMVRCTQLKIGQATALVEGVIQRARRRGASERLAGPYNVWALCLAMRGNYAGSAAAIDESLDLALASNNAQTALWALVSAAETAIFCGRLAHADAALHECDLLRKAGYSTAAEEVLVFLSFYAAFERGAFGATAQPLAAARALCQAGTMARPIMVEMAQEFVLMETGYVAQVTTLRRLTDEVFPFDCVYGSLYVAAHAYGLFLHALDGDWDALLATLRRLRGVLQTTGNALWAAWVAQSAALVAHGLQCSGVARRFFEQSQQLLRWRDITPTPRQTRAWQRVESAMADVATPHHAVAPPPEVLQAIEQLSAQIDVWCGLELAPPRLLPAADVAAQSASLATA
jgi:DNA-binding SARP family transcriptional activator/predicted ATPase